MSLSTEKPYNLIALYSPNPQMGKDSVANSIQYLTSEDGEYGLSTAWEVRRFGDKLKQMVERHFPQEFSARLWEKWGNDYRNEIMPSLNKTRREVLQGVGMKMREFDEDYWVKALFSDFHMNKFSVREGYTKTIISDLRLPNEYSAIEERGGLFIKVMRNSAIKVEHESEGQLENHFFHETIVNDSTLEEFSEKVKNILIKYKII